MHEQVAYVGVDLGTQSVRAAAVTAEGAHLAAAAQALNGRRAGRRHEQDPEQWWHQTAAALAEVCAEVVLKGHRIGAIATCATSGTIALTERSGRFLTPGLMYDDGRAAEDSQILEDVAASGHQLWSRLGYRMQPSWALPKLVWLARHGLWPTGARLVHQGDVINERLVGAPVPTDSGQALKTGVDLTNLTWDTAVLDTLGLDGSNLPDVVLPGTPIGQVCRTASAQTGLPVGIQVVAGSTDGCAAQWCAGAVSPGDWNSVLGTTLVVKGVTDRILHDPTGALYSHRAPFGNAWLPGGASSVGAGLLSQMFAGANLDNLTSQLPPDAWPAAVAYPLYRRGERFPFVAPRAHGSALIEGRFTSLEEMLSQLGEEPSFAAVLQGVAFTERLCFDLLDLIGAPINGCISLTGGGTRNSTWNQLRCDVLDVPVNLPDVAEPAVGASLLAASPEYALDTLAKDVVRVRQTLLPDPDRTGHLLDRYHEFLGLLLQQGWIGQKLATHATERSTR